MSPTAQELDAWLRLLRTPGVGRDGARRLLQTFGSAPAIFDASATALRAVLGADAARALAQPPEGHAQRCEDTQRWLEADPARHVITPGDAPYPAALLESPDPPLLLYAQGQLDALQRPAIAIVGSRNPTAQGEDNARQFAEHLARAGLCIVSGMALGIDGAAHEGALAAGGMTVAVMGTGADRVYPARHRELAHRIAANGLLLTEYDLGMPPLRENFPRRNRIIAALTRGTLVVEAALPSGSLSTAHAATECGREVFAIPGSIHSPQSRGCHALIKQGAKLVESAADVLGELQWHAPTTVPFKPPSAEVSTDPLLDALGHDPVSMDALGARTGLDAGTLGARLLELELDGHIARLPGGLFQRRGKA